MASHRKITMRKLAILLTMISSLIHSPATVGAQAARARTLQQSLNARSRRLSPSQIASVIRAVEDEIYDYSQEKAFDDIGIPANGPNGRSIKVSIYINPLVTADGEGEAIYKNMPYGEIVRIFSLSSDGMVVLAGGPSVGFPVTQISHLTVFMDDDELCRDKARWLRREFIVHESPSEKLVDEASKRQLSRVGVSHHLNDIDVQAMPR